MAKKNDKTERRAMVEQMRKDQARKERTRSLAILGVCVLIVAALIGSAAYVAIKDSNEKEKRRNTAISKLGEDAKAAGCSAIETRPSDKKQSHIPDGQAIAYDDSPPSFGDHRPVAAPFGRPFYSDDRPEIATLVHNLEHGYVIGWYDATLAEDSEQLKDLEAIATKFQDDQERFIAVPWRSEDGSAFPDGKHFALTRWTADADNPGDQAKHNGNWQYCASVSGDVVKDFLEKFPNAQSPEPGLM